MDGHQCYMRASLPKDQNTSKFVFVDLECNRRQCTNAKTVTIPLKDQTGAKTAWKPSAVKGSTSPTTWSSNTFVKAVDPGYYEKRAMNVEVGACRAKGRVKRDDSWYSPV